MCGCGTEVKTTEHFRLRCHFYSTQRFELFDNLERVTQTLKIWVVKTKSHLSYMVQKQIPLKVLIKILSKFGIKYLKTNETCVFIFGLMF